MRQLEIPLLPLKDSLMLRWIHFQHCSPDEFWHRWYRYWQQIRNVSERGDFGEMKDGWLTKLDLLRQWSGSNRELAANWVIYSDARYFFWQQSLNTDLHDSGRVMLIVRYSFFLIFRIRDTSVQIRTCSGISFCAIFHVRYRSAYFYSPFSSRSLRESTEWNDWSEWWLPIVISINWHSFHWLDRGWEWGP